MHRSKHVPDGSHARAAFQQMEQVACPICGANPIPFAIDHQGFQLCRCRGCKLECVSPRPTYEELRSKIYNTEYFPQASTEQELLLARQYQYHRQLDTIQSFFKNRGRILDVGCGDGSFLAYALKEGWDVTGMDIRLAQEALAKSCKLVEGQLGQVDLPPRSFDVIRFNHVLEHTQNPLTELELSRQLLTENGVIFISVPNLAGISARIKSFQSRLHLKSRQWRHYAAIHHLWYFTPASLKALVENAGLKTLKWETPVLQKSPQATAGEIFYRQTLERFHCASILDIYCTPL
jgi:2-polyprenyl-3-methyl-5-hydroxy-6-metoxy-1,4-benzoquinol methylase